MLSKVPRAMLRQGPRALAQTMSAVRTQPNRMYLRGMAKKSPLQVAFSNDEDEEVRYRTQKNPVIPNVDNLAERWNKMDAGQQDDIIAYLEDRMRGDWRTMTPAEKKAVHYIYYGPWGARGDHKEPGNVYGYIAAMIGLSSIALVGYQLMTIPYPDESV